MARFFREDFDRNREFVVARSFTFDTVRYEPHPTKTIDKSRFTLRRLRQLYDQRYLVFADPTRVAQESPPPKVDRYRPKVERYRSRQLEA